MFGASTAIISDQTGNKYNINIIIYFNFLVVSKNANNSYSSNAPNKKMSCNIVDIQRLSGDTSGSFFSDQTILTN